MPNILDIRRRIRSVVNTRQITKAMKVVSAAKLRRAQDRTMAARPYAQMLTNVLKSLVARAEIYDPETGQPKHPLPNLARISTSKPSAAKAAISCAAAIPPRQFKLAAWLRPKS